MVVIVWFVIKLDRRWQVAGWFGIVLFRLAVEILASRGTRGRGEAEAGVQGSVLAKD